ncbi:hypothetical protein Cadr_000023084 [Camelus dromedarius]|uniref:Uncharacterized protein n=1 Tax=Camelus dromedarius TaxID=9838 RepID=A0A5N4CHY1_CAMDR|nr:hypothetical protein Cadr_000023084 [Camelus dromedarius]
MFSGEGDSEAQPWNRPGLKLTLALRTAALCPSLCLSHSRVHYEMLPAPKRAFSHGDSEPKGPQEATAKPDSPPWRAGPVGCSQASRIGGWGDGSGSSFRRQQHQGSGIWHLHGGSLTRGQSAYSGTFSLAFASTVSAASHPGKQVLGSCFSGGKRSCWCHPGVCAEPQAEPPLLTHGRGGRGGTISSLELGLPWSPQAQALQVPRHMKGIGPLFLPGLQFL